MHYRIIGWFQQAFRYQCKSQQCSYINISLTVNLMLLLKMDTKVTR